MPQNNKGKRPAAPAAEETTAAPLAPIEQGETLPQPLLSPETATVVAQADENPFAQLSSILSDSAGGGGAAGAVGGMAPTFASVLTSIGKGVATSQRQMDEGFKKTVDRLKNKKIKVVTEVVQDLDDFGLPNADRAPELVTEEVSLINYLNPTQHAWSRISLSMDMSVSEIDAENGMTFHRDQTTVAGRGGTSWGFYGWFDAAGSHTDSTQTTTSETHAQWSSGQVRLDALLEAHHSEKLPVGVELEIGPRILFSQGAASEKPVPNVKGVLRRSVDVSVAVQKANGAVNPSVALITSCTPFGCAYSTGFSSTTNSEGRTSVPLTRDVPSGVAVPPAKGLLTVKLGKMVRTLEVTL